MWSNSPCLALVAHVHHTFLALLQENKMQHEEIRQLQFNTLVLKRIQKLQMPLILINTSNWIIKLSPTYSHRKKALKFFILLSITLNVQIKVAIWQNKKVTFRNYWFVFYRLTAEVHWLWERKSPQLWWHLHAAQTVFTNSKTTDLVLFMTVTLKGTGSVWRSVPSIASESKPRRSNFCFHKDIPLTSLRWYSRASEPLQDMGRDVFNKKKNKKTVTPMTRSQPENTSAGGWSQASECWSKKTQ